MTNPATDALAEEIKRLTAQRDAAVGALEAVEGISELTLTRGDFEYGVAQIIVTAERALTRIAELGKAEPKPRQITPQTRPPSSIPTYPKFPSQPEPWDGKERQHQPRRSGALDRRVCDETVSCNRRDGRDRRIFGDRRATETSDRRKPQPDAAGWIRWRGGECPVPDGWRFQMKFRDGRISSKYTDAPTWNWSAADDGTIIAYRLVEGEAIARKVLSYHPKPKSKPAKSRKRRATKIAKAAKP